MKTHILLSVFFYCYIGYSQKTVSTSISKNKNELAQNLSTSLKSFETLCKVMISQDTVTLKNITTKGGYIAIRQPNLTTMKKVGEYYLQNLNEKNIAVEYETACFSRIGIYYKNGHQMMGFVKKKSDEWKFDSFLYIE